MPVWIEKWLDPKRRGVEDRLLQRFLGHRDRRSLERYARVRDRDPVRFALHADRWLR